MFLEIAVGCMWVFYVFESYLDYRQHNKLLEKDVPPKIASIVSEDKFMKARAYGLDKSYYGFAQGLYSIIENTLVLQLFALPYVWKKCAEYVESYGYNSEEYEVTTSLVFVCVFYVWNLVTSTPWSLYYTFVIEEKHGFNKQTLKLYITDSIKGLGLGIAIGFPFLYVFINIIKWGGPYFYLYLWAFVFSFSMFMLTIYPIYIQPCFNEVTPLPEGELKSAIETLAKRIDFPLKKLFQIDGSKRSSHSNAYFYGFCKNKMIVLFDTLIEQSTTAEVVAVLGHELGHWHMMHMPKMLALNQIQILAQFALLGLALNHDPLFVAFGFTDGKRPVLIAFLLFNYMLQPLDKALGLLNTLLTRKHEFEADAFAVGLGYADDLRSGLIKLQIENLGNMNPDKLYSSYHYSHPPMVERLSAIEAEAKRTQKKST